MLHGVSPSPTQAGLFGFFVVTNIAFVLFPSCKCFGIVRNKMSRCLFVSSRSHFILLVIVNVPKRYWHAGALSSLPRKCL